MNVENVCLSYGIQTKLFLLSSGNQPLLSYDNSSIQKVQAGNPIRQLCLVSSMLSPLSIP